MKKLKTVLHLLILILVLSGCNSTQRPELPTPVVPSISEVEAAEAKWERANYPSYVINVEETVGGITRNILVIVDGGEIRYAQSMESVSGSEFAMPENFSLEEAKNYTVEALFAKVRVDALSAGPAPVNLDVIFNPSDGYPAVVSAEGISTFNEAGELQLNRDAGYLFSAELVLLLEESFGFGKTPIFTYSRMGGENIECDKLRIYADRSSIYTNECLQLLLQLHPPISMMDDLNSLLDLIEPTVLEDDIDRDLSLALLGNGSNAPTDLQIETLWELADNLTDLLSRPVGEGLTLLFSSNNQVKGISMLNLVTQPAEFNINGFLQSAIGYKDSSGLVFADNDGINELIFSTGSVVNFVAPNESNESVLIRATTEKNEIIYDVVSLDSLASLRWVSKTKKGINIVPIPVGKESYGCHSGVSVPKSGSMLAIGGEDKGLDCNLINGLTVVDLENQSASTILEGNVSAPSWSFDGEWIAFGLTDDQLISQIFIIHPDGSGLTQITNNLAYNAKFPIWASDGSLYFQRTGEVEIDNGIYRYELETEELNMVLRGENIIPINISPKDDYIIFKQEFDLKAFIFSFEEIIPVVVGSEQYPANFVGWLIAN